jgi:hypothetical protein
VEDKAELLLWNDEKASKYNPTLTRWRTRQRRRHPCCNETTNKLTIMTIDFIDRNFLRTAHTLQMGVLALVLKVGTAYTNIKSNCKMNNNMLKRWGVFCNAERIKEGHAILRNTKGTLNGRDSGLCDAGGIMKTQANKQRD